MPMQIDWPAIALQALADIKANAPLPPSPPMTEAQIKALLSDLQTDLPAAAAKVRAHPGVITAAVRVLDAVAADGEPWAGTLGAALLALPGGLATIQKYLPMAAGLITAFSPAPDARFESGPTPGRGR